MPILTSPKFISQERLDLEDLTTLLTGMTSDSQYFTKQFWAATQYILKGFSVSGLGGPSPASISLTNATLINPNNTGGFSWFVAQDGASPLTVNLNSSVRNYVELSLSNEDGTPLARAFWDPSANGGSGAEFSQTVNTLTSIQITATALTGGWSGSPNSIPVAIVDTDSFNNIKLILDKRPLFFRLINPYAGTSSFAWSSQTEPATTVNFTGGSGTFVVGETITFSGGATAQVVSVGSGTLGAISFSSDSFAVGQTMTGGTSGATGTVSTVSQAFSGADKDIACLRDIVTALQTEIKRLKGTQRWFEVGYGSVLGALNQIGSIVAQSSTSSRAAFSWDGSDLSITDSNGSPSGSDVLGVIRILGSGLGLNLLRADGQASTSKIAIPSGNVLFVQLPASGSVNYSGTGSGATNYQVVPRGSYVVSDQNYWLAYVEGSMCYVRGIGEMETGESALISNPLSLQFLANIGFTDEDAAPVYSSNIRGASGESLVSRLGTLTDAIGDGQEDRSAILRSDGTLTWSGTQLSFSNNLVLEIINTKSGTTTTHTVSSSASPLSLNAGECAYVSINRTPSGNAESVTLVRSSVTPIPAQSQSNKDTFVLFKSYQTGGGTKYLFCPLSKQVLQPNDTFNLGSTISQNLYTQVLGVTDSNSSPTYTSNIRGVSTDTFATRLSTLTDAIGDSQEDRSAYLRSNANVVWSGSSLTFTSDIVLEILNTKSGTTTTHTISSSSYSPLSLSAGDFAYILINRNPGGGTETCTLILNSVTPIPAQIQAKKDVIVLFKAFSVGATTNLYIPLLKQCLIPGNNVALGTSPGAISTNAYPNVFLSPAGNGTATTLSAALSALPPGGGVILLMDAMTISSPITISQQNVKILGRNKNATITFTSTGSITWTGSGGSIEDLAFATSTNNIMVSVQGDDFNCYTCNFAAPPSGTATCLQVQANGFYCEASVFSGVAAPSTSTGIEFDSGYVDGMEIGNIYTT